MTAASQATAGEADGPSSAGLQARVPERLRLPLLKERLDAIGDRKRSRWLDFGGVQPALVDRLSVGPHRLRVADLDLPGGHGTSTDPSLPLRGSSAEIFDIVLAWDWLNHFDAAGVARLGAQVARHAEVGATLHALIHYASSAMPPQPVDYRLTGDGEVEFWPWSPGPKPAPRYSPKALEKAMPDWQVDRTLLLNNGMQEFLLRRRSRSGSA